MEYWKNKISTFNTILNIFQSDSTIKSKCKSCFKFKV